MIDIFVPDQYIKRLAINNDIIWQDEWQDGDSVKFNMMPEDIAGKIKKLSKDYLLSCESRDLVPKHKYVYVLGSDNRETKQLRKIFLDRNKTYIYPKDRGI